MSLDEEETSRHGFLLNERWHPSCVTVWEMISLNQAMLGPAIIPAFPIHPEPFDSAAVLSPSRRKGAEPMKLRPVVIVIVSWTLALGPLATPVAEGNSTVSAGGAALQVLCSGSANGWPNPTFQSFDCNGTAVLTAAGTDDGGVPYLVKEAGVSFGMASSYAQLCIAGALVDGVMYGSSATHVSAEHGNGAETALFTFEFSLDHRGVAGTVSFYNAWLLFNDGHSAPLNLPIGGVAIVAPTPAMANPCASSPPSTTLQIAFGAGLPGGCAGSPCDLTGIVLDATASFSPDIPVLEDGQGSFSFGGDAQVHGFWNGLPFAASYFCSGSGAYRGTVSLLRLEGDWSCFSFDFGVPWYIEGEFELTGPSGVLVGATTISWDGHESYPSCGASLVPETGGDYEFVAACSSPTSMIQVITVTIKRIKNKDGGYDTTVKTDGGKCKVYAQAPTGVGGGGVGDPPPAITADKDGIYRTTHQYVRVDCEAVGAKRCLSGSIDAQSLDDLNANPEMHTAGRLRCGSVTDDGVMKDVHVSSQQGDRASSENVEGPILGNKLRCVADFGHNALSSVITGLSAPHGIVGSSPSQVENRAQGLVTCKGVFSD